MKKLLFLIPFCLLSALPSMAQYVVEDDGASSVVMNFLALPRDPSSMAVGGQYAFGGSPAYAVFANPAAVPCCKEMVSAAFSYGMWQPSMAAASTAYSGGFSINNAGKFGISVGFATDPLKSKTVPSDNDGTRTDGPQPSTLMVGGGFSFRPVDWLSLGVSLKYANQSLVGDDMSVIAGDAFIMFRNSGFSAVAGIRNLGDEVESGYSIPRALVFGASYSLCAGIHSLSASVECDRFSYGAVRVCAGGTYSIADIFSVSAGYNYGGDSPFGDFVSTGIGLNLDHICLSGAYLVADGPLDGTFCLGLELKF